MRAAAALLAAAMIAMVAMGAGAPVPARALAPGSPEGVAPVSISSTDGFGAVDERGREVTTLRDLSDGEVTLRAATTSAGLPVIVTGVTGAGGAEVRDLEVGAAATPGSVALAWTAIPQAGEYAVYRDGVLIGVTAGVEFVDRGVRPGASHGYTLEADVLLEPEPVEDPATGETVYPDRWTGYRLHLPVAVPPEDNAGLASATEDFAAQTTAQSTSTFTYKTFIAEETAPGFPCVLWPTNTYFGGDDRDWVAGPGGGSRTVMTATAHWDAESLATSTAVGDTVNYNSDGTVRETRTASMAGMLFVDVDVTSTRASFRLDHSATNPFCESTGGEIRYNVAVSVYRLGAYILTGWRRPVPHHEAYVRHDSDAWHTVLQRTNSGFHCLTGVCGTESLNEVGNF